MSYVGGKGLDNPWGHAMQPRDYPHEGDSLPTCPYRIIQTAGTISEWPDTVPSNGLVKKSDSKSKVKNHLFFNGKAREKLEFEDIYFVHLSIQSALPF